jgi:hypothetical protein
MDIIHCEMPKLVKALFEASDEGFYDECRGNYDVRLKIRDVGVTQSLCCVTVDEYWWSSLVNVNLEQWLGVSHGEKCLGQASLSNSRSNSPDH